MGNRDFLNDVIDFQSPSLSFVTYAGMAHVIGYFSHFLSQCYHHSTPSNYSLVRFLPAPCRSPAASLLLVSDL